jgi:hypothetical protein
LFSNQLWLLLTARLLTAVGLLRASMGPPIMVMVSGVVSPRLAISETAASTGTVGWHTEITCTFGADVADELLHVVHVVVQVERALGQRHHAGVGPVGDEHLVVVQQGS